MPDYACFKAEFFTSDCHYATIFFVCSPAHSVRKKIRLPSSSLQEVKMAGLHVKTGSMECSCVSQRERVSTESATFAVATRCTAMISNVWEYLSTQVKITAATLKSEHTFCDNQLAYFFSFFVMRAVVGGYTVASHPLNSMIFR